MLSKELLEKTVAEAIDITRNQYAKTDSVYKMELEKLEKLLKEYENLPLEKEARSKIDAYMRISLILRESGMHVFGRQKLDC